MCGGRDFWWGGQREEQKSCRDEYLMRIGKLKCGMLEILGANLRKWTGLWRLRATRKVAPFEL